MTEPSKYQGSEIQSVTDHSLDIRNLTKEYTRGVPVLQSVSVSIEANGITAIIGPSGTGKSTLIRCINRLIDPT